MRRAVMIILAVSVLAATTAATSPGQGASGTTLKTAFNKKLKTTILVTSRGLTLYYWTQDSGKKSNCVNDPTYHCSKWWPPLLTTGAPVATAGAKRSLLGTTKRADGTTQVTYAGHPVYRFQGVGSPLAGQEARRRQRPGLHLAMVGTVAGRPGRQEAPAVASPPASPRAAGTPRPTRSRPGPLLPRSHAVCGAAARRGSRASACAPARGSSRRRAAARPS